MSNDVRRGYADTPHGQLHYRRSAGSGADIVLLHWAPASGRMYERVIPALRELGLDAVAFDLPGFGMSLRPPATWGPELLARSLLDALDDLGARNVVVLGGHVSAGVAVEMALAAPGRVSAIVLDGVYACTDDEAAALMVPYAGLSPSWKEDGSHERFAWRMTEGFLHEWNPRYQPGPQAMAATFDALCDYLQMGYDAIRAWIEPEPGTPPPPAYDVLQRLSLVRAPVLVLTAEEEALRPGFDRALRANSGAQGVEFAGNHPLFVPERTAEYARVVAAFAAERRS